MKKIALLIGDISSEFQSNLTLGLYKRATEYGYKLHVFVVYGLYGVNAFHNYSELCSLQIPDLNEYDIVLIVPNTFEAEGTFEKFRKTVLSTVVCPIISIRSEDPDYYSIVYDDYTTMRSMVEHFVNHHHMSRIAYVSGPVSRKDASERYRAYRDVMSENRFPINDHMVYYGNFWKNEGEAIVDWLLPDEDHIPEAIVCANDYMAEAVLTTLHRRGYRIPEDICVSGYDDLTEVQYLTPPLTTIRVDTDGLGARTIDVAKALIEKQPIEKTHLHPSSPIFRQSCGCPAEDNSQKMKTLFQSWINTQFVIGNITNMSTDFANINNYASLTQASIPYVSNCFMDKIYVCLCNDEEKQQEKAEMDSKFTEHMVLKTILTTNDSTNVNIPFARKDILPKQYLDEIDLPIITAMYNRDSFLGYFVADCLHVTDLPKTQYIFRCWVQEFSATVCRLKVYEENLVLSNVWEISNHDELTGVYNRRGIELFLQENSFKTMNSNHVFCVMTTDMDGLKHINDTYGHAEGDTAIITFAHILKEECKDMGRVARVGGDEFTIGLETSDPEVVNKIMERVKARIDDYNLTSHKPYLLSASVGYAFCSRATRLSEAMRIADKDMYDMKARHKKERTFDINN